MTSQAKEEAGSKFNANRIEGKYLTFTLGDEEYGLEILKVREIIGLMEITSVPQTPEFIKGVINLRGKVIPVIDLRLKFGMEEAVATEETCIIVVDIVEMLMGILVDTVSEVVDVPASNIEPPPAFGNNISTEFILGMGKLHNKVKILLDIAKVLSQKEMMNIAMLEGIETDENPR
ncbi:MAG: chemotaxis protein CheW [Nitrospinota bacterium]|nr:chemotaxis protein CheW [Nitrospinota bacterium]MDH5678210.1 chemotaxis protein CheW [Nitrospinota bacterium]MDH5756067.1 chemotaxis protein CheW [Nitrospinota bacterium]